jgi:sialidase-1
MAYTVRKALLIVSVLSFCVCAYAQQLDYDILSRQVIAQQPGRYMGWPTIAVLDDGRLMVVFSGDRDWHVCPWGKTQFVTGSESGKTWSEIQTINNTPFDDRDAGILVTSKGTLLLSWFTSSEFMNKSSPLYVKRYYKYEEHSGKITADARQKWLSYDGTGYWVRRSEDNGKTWGDYIKTPGNSPHGPIKLKDGRLLYAAKNEVAESTDDGMSWQVIGQIPAEESCRRNERLWKQQLFDRSESAVNISYLDEVHAVEAGNGDIIALSRYQGKGGSKHDKYLRQSVSKDGGRTWSVLKKTEMLGYPPHLLKLKNGLLLATYGRRVAPMGQRACLSYDNGRSWDVDNEIIISDAVPQSGADLGYPSTAELEDGSLYTVFYQKPEDAETPAIMGVHWRLERKFAQSSSKDPLERLLKDNLIFNNKRYSVSQMKVKVSSEKVESGESVYVEVVNKQQTPSLCVITTPYTVGEHEAVKGFRYDPELKMSYLKDQNRQQKFNIDTSGWESGVYNLTVLCDYKDSYDYRDISITVQEEDPAVRCVVEWDKSISDKKEGLGSFLKIKDGIALAGSFMTSDGGESWKKPAVPLGYMVANLSDGSIITFSGRIKPLGNGTFKVRAVFYDKLLNETESYNVIFELPQFRAGIAHGKYDTPLAFRSIVELEDGTLLCTMYGRFDGDNVPWNWTTGDKGATKLRALVMRSKDGGRTWHYLSTAGIDTSGLTMEGFNESVMGRIPDGRLMILMRTGDNAHRGWERNDLYASFSNDRGINWTEPRSTGVEGVAPDFCVMRDGIIACSYGRPGVKIMFSLDNGQSWCGHTGLNAERYRGYTAICEIEPGVLLVGYRVKNSFCKELNTRIKEQIRMARIRVSRND